MKQLSKTAVLLSSTLAVFGALPMTVQADEVSLKVGGRIMFDYNNASADVGNGEWSATELRRARLNISGKYGSNIKYKVEFNTNSSEEINLEDAYVQWTPDGENWNVKIGQFKTMNSLDEMASSRFMSVLERAAFTDAFEFNRRIGVALNSSGKNYTLSAGVFGKNTGDSSDQEGYVLSARGTYTPINTNGDLVHLGAAIRYRDQGDSEGDIRYRQRPYAHIPGRIISTGAIAQSDTFLGLEAAGMKKNFWAAGEYGMTNAACSTCVDDPSFNGGYIEAGLFFGGRRTYKGGTWNRPKVDQPINQGGMGAVSLVARYDTLDLSDDSVNGGKLDTVVLGVDWYPVKNIRLGVNYFNADADLGTSTSGLDSDFAALIGSETQASVDGIVARMQFDF